MNEFNRIRFSGSFNKYDILDRLGIEMSGSFMSPMDHDLLLGLLERKRPKKVVEIGVARGGTTLLLLDWLKKLGLDMTEVFSVDIDPLPSCGELISEGKKITPEFGKNHTLIKGKVISEVIENIGQDIDFVIIDTFHLVPCEIFDFLSIFPFLTHDAVVVLHDVGKNMRDLCRAEATKILFDAVVADKFWNWDAEKYPNIAGFQLNGDTEKYMMSVVASLGMTWGYNPGERVIDGCGRIIKKYYSQEMFSLYKNICEKNLEAIYRRSSWMRNILVSLIDSISDTKKVFLFGAGKMAERILRTEEIRKRITAILISDDQQHPEKLEGVPVRTISDYSDFTDYYVINTLTKWEIRTLIHEKLKERGVKDTMFDLFGSDQFFDLFNAFEPDFFV